MGIFDFIVLLIIAGICGSIAQAIAGMSRGGCLVSIAVGFIGALLGSWLAGKLDLPELLTIDIGGRPFPIVWSILGGAIFAALISLLTRGRGRGDDVV